jgi:hypothetical protein
MKMIHYDGHKVFLKSLRVNLALEDDLRHNNISPRDWARIDTGDLPTKVVERKCQRVSPRAGQELKVVQLGPTLLW